MLRIVAIAAVLTYVAPFVFAAEPPHDVLARHGLRMSSGRWIPVEQHRLERLLARFDEQHREFYSTRRAWRQQLKQVEELEEEFKTHQDRYDQLDRQRTSNPLAQQQLQQQRGVLATRLRELRLALKRLQDDESKLHEASRLHAHARGELMAMAAALKDARSRVEEDYAGVSQSNDVAQAIQDLRTTTGADVQIGTMEVIKDDCDAALERAAKALGGHEFPLSQGSGYARLTTTINGQPVTFLVDDKHAQTLIPLGQVERLGLVAPAPPSGTDHSLPIDEPRDALRWESIQYGGDELMAARIVLPSLQVGDVVLHDAVAFVTDRDHENLGPRLGTDVADELDIRIDRTHARIVVGRASPPDPNAVD